MRTTIVRFTNAEKYPIHGYSDEPGTNGKWEQHRGREVEILLPPEEPSAYWSCGTPWVWAVSPRWLRENGLQEKHYCCCIHQLQMD